MTHQTLLADLQAALTAGDALAVQGLLHTLPPADIASLLAQQPSEQSVASLKLLPLRARAEVFGYMPITMQQAISTHVSDGELSELLGFMDADERADLFNVLPPDRREPLMRRLAKKARDELIHLSSYPEGSAGAIMTSEYVTLPARVTAADALSILRYTAPRAETIYQVYIVDPDGRLTGTASLRDIILARPTTLIQDLIHTEVIHANTLASQEEVARLISRYDLLALPIIDTENRLVGIVTYDDAMDVAEAEATEDMHKGATVGKLGRGLLDTTLFTLYRKRIVWLILLVFVNIFSGAGIAYFEDTIAAYVALVFFLPLLIGSGGNVGAQASTLMVRGLATGDVSGRDWARLLGRELIVAAGLGLTMALAVSFIGALRAGPELALVVGSSMVVIVIIGSLIGMGLPFILNRLGWDPATASAPLVTSIADITGVVIYFSIATAILIP